jgi:Ni/Co efflux regulator RcnB
MGGQAPRPSGGPHRPGEGRPPGFRPVQGRPWRYPQGYGYRRWTIGLSLPAIFLGSAYSYNDYAMLGLEPPPPGYRWVRYGPDLLLVQAFTGRIVDVIYGAFY